MMEIKFTQTAWSDYIYWQTKARKTLKKINMLIEDIERNRYNGIGKPEPLRANLSGWYSRRIDEANRIVYRITENGEVAEILQCRGHYYSEQ